MTSFNYSFQKILDLKESEKEIAQIQMADAIKEQEDGHRKSEAILNKIVDVQHLKKEKELAGVNIVELIMIENYINQLQEQLVSSNYEKKFLDNKVLKSQNFLQEKAKEEKTWLNLKKQKLNLFKDQTKAVEQNLLDEMASTRFYHASKA